MRRADVVSGFAIISSISVSIKKERANGLRYLRVGGRGFCMGAEKKPKARKMPENAAESHTSGARCVCDPFARNRCKPGDERQGHCTLTTESSCK